MTTGEPIPGVVPVDIAQTSIQIANLLQTKLTAREITVPEIENTGANALLGTNETIADGFLEELRRQESDGYFIGIGLGHALAFLPQLYNQKQLPKGVVLADIDPRVVVVGKLLFDKLASSSNAETFNREFFGQSEEAFLAEIEAHKATFSEALRRRVDHLGEAAWRKVYQGIQQDFEYSKNSGGISKTIFKQGRQTDVIHALGDPLVFQFYKTLLEQGNITIEYTDFTNPVFIQAVKELPDFSRSRNIIYTSNIVDHITHRGRALENLKLMDNLRQFEDSEEVPIFLDALQANNYYLRAANRLPTYQAKDFKRNFIAWSEKPTGLLFEPQVIDLEHMDITALPDRVLQRYYEQFMKSEEAKIVKSVAKDYFYLDDITKPESVYQLASERSFRRARFKEAGQQGKKQKQEEALDHPLYSKFLWGDEFIQFSSLYLEMRKRKIV